VQTDLPEARMKPFLGVPIAMSFEDADIRMCVEMEGLRRWQPGKTTGYAQLEASASARI
jgi:phosphonate transport system substrate-binding protein